MYYGGLTSHASCHTWFSATQPHLMFNFTHPIHTQAWSFFTSTGKKKESIGVVLYCYSWEKIKWDNEWNGNKNEVWGWGIASCFWPLLPSYSFGCLNQSWPPAVFQLTSLLYQSIPLPITFFQFWFSILTKIMCSKFHIIIYYDPHVGCCG